MPGSTSCAAERRRRPATGTGDAAATPSAITTASAVGTAVAAGTASAVGCAPCAARFPLEVERVLDADHRERREFGFSTRARTSEVAEEADLLHAREAEHDARRDHRDEARGASAFCLCEQSGEDDESGGEELAHGRIGPQALPADP